MPSPAEMPDPFEGLPPVIGLQSLAFVLASVVLGAVTAILVLPHWAPGMGASMVGASPKGFWYLSRASALTAYAMMWLSVAFGLTITNKLARVWPGGPVAFDLHQHVSLLGLALALFHGLVLLGDRFTAASLGQLALPFALNQYRPVWVGLGQVGIYLMAGVTLSYYVRRSIGHKMWRRLHYLSFLAFVLAAAHGIASGTDTGLPLVRAMYWVSAGSVLFLTVYRILAAVARPARSAPAAAREGRPHGAGALAHPVPSGSRPAARPPRHASE